MQTTEEGLVAASERNLSNEIERICKQIQKSITLMVVGCDRVLGASIRTTDPIGKSVMEAVQQQARVAKET